MCVCALLRAPYVHVVSIARLCLCRPLLSGYVLVALAVMLVVVVDIVHAF